MSNTEQSPPTVSVLLPVHNAGRYVAETIASVLGQSYRDFEFLIIDDGSTDRSLDEINVAVGQDPRVQVLSQANAGFARTLNRLIAESTGKYLARIDADDIAEPTRFERQVDFLDEHSPCVLVASAITQIDQDGDPYAVVRYPTDPVEIEQNLLRGNACIIHPSVMLRRSAVEQVGGYALDVPVVEDQELWFRLARVGELAIIDEPLTRYRIHADNMSFRQIPAAVEAYNRMIRVAYQDRGLTTEPPQNRVPENDDLAWQRERRWAWTAIESGYLGTARKHARRLLMRHPNSIDCWKLFAFAYCGGPVSFARKILGR